MKIKVVVLCCLAGGIILSAGYEGSLAKSQAKALKAGPKIGVVSIRKIFQECKRNVKYRQEAGAEQNRVIAELDKLDKEIEAERAGLKTLVAGSSDYMQQLKDILEKQAKRQAHEEFHKQQIAFKDRQWTERLYRDILRTTDEVAAGKGLDLVFENSEPELPASSTNDLILAIRTHKLLYSVGCLDISNEVIARLDAGN